MSSGDLPDPHLPDGIPAPDEVGPCRKCPHPPHTHTMAGCAGCRNDGLTTNTPVAWRHAYAPPQPPVEEPAAIGPDPWPDAEANARALRAYLAAARASGRNGNGADPPGPHDWMKDPAQVEPPPGAVAYAVSEPTTAAVRHLNRLAIMGDLIYRELARVDTRIWIERDTGERIELRIHQ